MNSTLSSCMRWLCLGVFVLIMGCDTQPPVGPDEVNGDQANSLIAATNGANDSNRQTPIYSDDLCDVDSGIAPPDHYIRLKPARSETKYPEGSVSVPTLVSFGICDLDTTGIRLAPKMAVFGPSPSQTFLRPVEVKLDKDDAGIDGVSNGTDYYLFRFSELTFMWDFVLSAQVESGECRFTIIRNGTYAVSLVDSVSFGVGEWTTTGTVTPENGGVLDLLNSSFEVEPGAIVDPATVEFTIRAESPVGVRNATPRIYQFGPEGLSFSIPATMTISYEDAGYDGMIDEQVFLYYFDPDEDAIGNWVRQPQPVERSNGAFVVELHHFSRYAFGR